MRNHMSRCCRCSGPNASGVILRPRCWHVHDPKDESDPENGQQISRIVLGVSLLCIKKWITLVHPCSASLNLGRNTFHWIQWLNDIWLPSFIRARSNTPSQGNWHSKSVQPRRGEKCQPSKLIGMHRLLSTKKWRKMNHVLYYAKKRYYESPFLQIGSSCFRTNLHFTLFLPATSWINFEFFRCVTTFFHLRCKVTMMESASHNSLK